MHPKQKRYGNLSNCLLPLVSTKSFKTCRSPFAGQRHSREPCMKCNSMPERKEFTMKTFASVPSNNLDAIFWLQDISCLARMCGLFSIPLGEILGLSAMSRKVFFLLVVRPLLQSIQA